MRRETGKKQETKKLLADVAKEQTLFCHGGKEIRNLKELSDALSTTADETYDYHWDEERKTYSYWVRNMVGDIKLANDLEKATSRNHAAWEVANRIVYLARLNLLA